jgi:hypothetical protein
VKITTPEIAITRARKIAATAVIFAFMRRIFISLAESAIKLSPSNFFVKSISPIMEKYNIYNIYNKN